jgi:hypothetical protein
VAWDDREALLQILNRVRPGRDGRRISAGAATGAPIFAVCDRHPLSGNLSPEDQEFVRAMRQALVDFAAGAGAGALIEERQRAVRTALDGAELVIVGQLTMGRGQELHALLPSLVFLIALPIVRQDAALKLSRRAQQLAEQSLG